MKIELFTTDYFKNFWMHTPELFSALTPPLVAAILAIWIASWQGLPYLVLLGPVDKLFHPQTN